MRSGFFRGLFVGAVVGTVSGMLIDSEHRQKAKQLIHTGGELIHKVEDGMGMANGWINKGRELMQDDLHPLMQGMGGSGEMTEMFGQGKQAIDSRIAALEKRLEEIEGLGAQ